METAIFRPIAYIHSPFSQKFGIPRQSGLAEEIRATVVFEPEYRVEEALRGLDRFSHLWPLWEFSLNWREGWSPTVRPPRIGGNQRLGVFATRSPFRPNPIGLSCVALEKVEVNSPKGPLLFVKGADLLDGSPIFDIKPYVPLTDCHPEASGGFSEENSDYHLKVVLSPELEEKVPEQFRRALREVLREDPRPAYHKDPSRVYGMAFAGLEIKFTVEGKVLTVQGVT